MAWALRPRKKWIAQKVIDRAECFGLKIDVSWKEEDRVYEANGLSFQKFTLNLVTESGSSITDRVEVKKLVEEYVALNLGWSLSRLIGRYSTSMRQYSL